MRCRWSCECRTKQGRKTRALRGISWYHWMYKATDEVSHKPSSLQPSTTVHTSHSWPPVTCQKTLRYTDMVSSNNFLGTTCLICRKRSRKKLVTCTLKISCEIEENCHWNLRLVTWSVWWKAVELLTWLSKIYFRGCFKAWKTRIKHEAVCNFRRKLFEEDNMWI